MIIRVFFSFFAICLLDLIPSTRSAVELDGRTFMRELTSRVPEKKTQFYGYLSLRLVDNQRREIPVKFLTEPFKDHWITQWETQTSGGIMAERLTVHHYVDRPNSYQWSSLDQTNSTFQNLICTNLYKPFAQTEFWLLDLGLDFFHWPNQKILRTEMRKGRSCRVVESTNPPQPQSRYSRVVSWIDIEAEQPIRVEIFDENSKLLKIFSILGVRKTGNKVQLKDLEIRNEQTETRTRLNLELEIDQ